MSIRENLHTLKKSLPSDVTLVAVSKTMPIEVILEAYDAGQRIFGENKVQEIVQKQSILPKDIRWHFIGHLQSNKVKFIAPFVNLVHSIDSLKLLQVLDNEAKKNNRVIQYLFQLHIAKEETKHGLSVEELMALISSPDYKALIHVTPVGLMGMATFTDNMNAVRQEFKTLQTIFRNVKTNYFEFVDGFNEISMGMSDDFPVALEEGSTMIRVGSLLFGSR